MAKNRIPALKVEANGGTGPMFYLSLLEYKRENYLCIIDNMMPSEIGAYVLDYADQENIPLQEFLSIVTKWFYSKSESRPLSVEIANYGLTEQLAPLYRTFDSTYVTRIVGNAFTYDGMNKSKVRRRRVVPIPEGIAIKLKKPALAD
jgi:hypothetical protein